MYADRPLSLFAAALVLLKG